MEGHILSRMTNGKKRFTSSPRRKIPTEGDGDLRAASFYLSRQLIAPSSIALVSAPQTWVMALRWSIGVK